VLCSQPNEDQESNFHRLWWVRPPTNKPAHQVFDSSIHSSSGLGLATVQDLLTSNAYISIIDRSPPDPNTHLSPKYVKLFLVDITKPAEIEHAVEETVAWTKETGAPLGGVVNCAGVGIAAKVRYTYLQYHLNAPLKPYIKSRSSIPSTTYTRLIYGTLLSPSTSPVRST